MGGERSRSGYGWGAARPLVIALVSHGMALATRSEKPRDGGYRHRRLGPSWDSSGTEGSSEFLVQGEGSGKEGRRAGGSASRPDKHTERDSDKMPDGADMYK